MSRIRQCSLLTVAVLALCTGCHPESSRKFWQQVYDQQFAEMEESSKLVHSRTLAEAVGLMAPPGPCAINGVCFLYLTDACAKAAWSNPQLLENTDDVFLRHLERVCELFSVLRLFAPVHIPKPE